MFVCVCGMSSPYCATGSNVVCLTGWGGLLTRETISRRNGIYPPRSSSRFAKGNSRNERKERLYNTRSRCAQDFLYYANMGALRCVLLCVCVCMYVCICVIYVSFSLLVYYSATCSALYRSIPRLSFILPLTHVNCIRS